MNDRKHIHLIGICGTAMASLAGMLKQRGFRITGSDAAAYPPMSDFLRELGYSRGAAFRRQRISNLVPDLVVVGNAMSRGNVELEHVARPAHSILLIAAVAARRIPSRAKKCLVVAGTHGKTTTTSMLAWIFRLRRTAPVVL
jgi:UDP-N-acetylmuramate: L-alanyl-gamma-D-glutamyl-meso-diaminopimelate ligase